MLFLIPLLVIASVVAFAVLLSGVVSLAAAIYTRYC